MTNPAAELHSIISGWHEANGSCANAQRMSNPDNGREESLRAVQLLIDIREQLQAMKSKGSQVDIYLAAIPHWWNIIFHYSHDWNYAAVVPEKLDILAALIPVMDAIGVEVDALPIDKYRQQLSDILETVRDDENLTEDLRHYLVKTIHHLNILLDEEEMGTSFDIGRALSRLAILLDAAAWQSEPHRDTYSKASKFFRHPSMSGFIGAAITTGANTTMKMLGS